MMEALGKFLAKHGPKLKGAGEWMKQHPLATGIGGAAAIGGAGVAAEPMIDDFMTDQALNSMKRSAVRGLKDATEFASEHPYLTATALGGSGLLGAGLGEENFANLYDTVSPFKLGPAVRMKKRHER